MWHGNKKHGQGLFTWPSGSKYTGEFVDDKRHGEGMLEYADGSTYVGGWRNEYKDG